MKIKNMFKKSEKTVAKANVQKLEKNQLEKVVGGVDTLITPGTEQDLKIKREYSGDKTSKEW